MEEIEPTPSTSMSENIPIEIKVKSEFTIEPEEIMDITKKGASSYYSGRAK